MRRVALALALFTTTACGSPVVGETTSPPGEIVDALADPEAHARCVPAPADELPACWCRTICPEGLAGAEGRCVEPGAAMGATSLGGACPFKAAADVRTGCEVPDWPLYRCDLGRL